VTDITEMQKNAQKRHREVLEMVEALSDIAISDAASSVCNIHYLWGMSITLVQISRVYSGSHNRYIVLLKSLKSVV
jgi:hypothetical protein